MAYQKIIPSKLPLMMQQGLLPPQSLYRVQTWQDMRILHALVIIVTLFCIIRVLFTQKIAYFIRNVEIGTHYL